MLPLERTQRLCLFLLLAVCLLWAAPFAKAANRPEYQCRWAAGDITLDGQADEKAWQGAQEINRFYLPWLQEKSRAAKTSTKARLLWDRDYLYFYAEMEDSDLYADIKEHDGATWNNDVFELFFKPAADKPGYYEFQVSPAGTTLDMFLPRRASGGFARFKSDGEFHLEAKVVLQGTLNRWEDKDQGWQVEGRLPWRDFVKTGGRPAVDETWQFALCRYDYSVAFEGPELSTCAPLSSKRRPDFHHHEDYADLRFVGPEKKDLGELYGIEKGGRVATSRVKGSPEPPLPYRAVRAYPKLKLNFPIFAVREPGSRRLWFIDQKWSYGPARICRTSEDPESGQYEELCSLEGVAYSIAFHPDFAKNGYVYLGSNGAAEGGKRTRITRYTIDRKTDKFQPESKLLIIDWPSDGHNGGAIAFGNDGMLYITSGDGTSDSDDNVMGQGLDHLLAKVLRIDVDKPSKERPYSVPRDNPFVNTQGARPETWAYGLRNPWRMCADPKTGHLWVGNNGQDLWEQAYLIERGANYGWSVYEGSHLFYPNRKLGPTPVSKPTLEHPHSEARSLTGGVVYYGDKLPELEGAYIYGDYSTGKIWAARHDGQKVVWHKELADTPLAISAFALDSEGNLLVVDHQREDGGFYRLEPNPQVGKPSNFPRKLSETGLFANVARHEMAAGVIPYSVNAPLWSDGAYKARWIALPPEMGSGDDREPASIPFSRKRGWDLPDATVLIKSFALEMEEGNPQSRKWIETRFLLKEQGEWAGYSYRWNDEQTEAELVDKVGLDRVYQIDTPQGRTPKAWRFPSRTECMVCHSRAANFVLGPSLLQMNKVHDYGAVQANQLQVLEELGLFKVNWKGELLADLREALKAPGKSKQEINEEVKRLTATRLQRSPPATHLLAKSPQRYQRLVDPYDHSQPIALRARSYLHANCAQCHVKAGGGNARIELDFDTPLKEMQLIGQSPVHHKFDLQQPLLVAPGEPERSVLLHRVSMRGRGQMPQLATNEVDEQAVKMLREWILSLEKDTSGD